MDPRDPRVERHLISAGVAPTRAREMLATLGGELSLGLAMRWQPEMRAGDAIDVEVIDSRTEELRTTWHLRVRDVQAAGRLMVVVGVVGAEPLLAAWSVRYRMMSFADVGPLTLGHDQPPPVPETPIRIAADDIRRLAPR